MQRLRCRTTERPDAARQLVARGGAFPASGLARVGARPDRESFLGSARQFCHRRRWRPSRRPPLDLALSGSWRLERPSAYLEKTGQFCAYHHDDPPSAVAAGDAVFFDALIVLRCPAWLDSVTRFEIQDSDIRDTQSLGQPVWLRAHCSGAATRNLMKSGFPHAPLRTRANQPPLVPLRARYGGNYGAFRFHRVPPMIRRSIGLGAATFSTRAPWSSTP